MIPNELVEPLENLLRDLVRRNYSELERDGRIGRVTSEDLERRIAEYGRTLIDVPRQALEGSDVYTVEDGKEWAVDIDLWTQEEGQSDLTLSVTARRTAQGMQAEIDDLRVL